MPRIIQFIHPGPEHQHGGASRMPWNRDGHKRKFLVSPGRAVDRNGVESDGKYVFWGEWEPPSEIIERWAKKGDHPTALHKPVWKAPEDQEAFRQNTDPWVFGDQFRYSNCQQRVKNATVMQRLEPGDIVLFGSHKQGGFVLDTVFVVGAEGTPYVPSQWTDEDAVFQTCTVDSLATDPKSRGKEFTLYRGATTEAPINGMYSFVPCCGYNGDDSRFERPRVVLPELINPGLTQNKKVEKLNTSEITEAWEAVCEQVFAHGCELGVWFETPHKV